MISPYTTTTPSQHRLFSTTHRRPLNNDNNSSNNTTNTHNPATPPQPNLTPPPPPGAAHMVSISDNPPTNRAAQAKCTVRFSPPAALALVRANQVKKGDVLGVARVAGLMAAKRT